MSLESCVTIVEAVGHFGLMSAYNLPLGSLSSTGSYLLPRGYSFLERRPAPVYRERSAALHVLEGPSRQGTPLL